MSAISHDSSLLNVEKLFLGSSIAEISKASLLDAQKEDPVVGRLEFHERRNMADVMGGKT